MQIMQLKFYIWMSACSNACLFFPGLIGFISYALKKLYDQSVITTCFYIKLLIQIS